MKILHTADWHIGKQLHQYNLNDDIALFFDFLLDYIKNENIDLLLISGDIFDHSNPSQQSFKLYYDFLRALTLTQCQAIITGGNHDSASVLNAPKALLEAFQIKVIGGKPDNINDLFFEFEKDKEKIIIAAVPFLKDKDIRLSEAGEDYTTKIEQTQIGLKEYFTSVNEFYQNNFAPLPFILMAHLYVQGSATSESEREIQVGNQAGVQAEIFENIPHYVALGHIHKPQTVSASSHIFYSGSPIALSFSEREDRKYFNVITFKDNALAKIEKIKIPTYRKLISITGNIDSVRTQLTEYTCDTPLTSLAEIIVTESTESSERRQAFEEVIQSYNNTEITIVKSKLLFTNKEQGASDIYSLNADIEDISPLDMFQKKLMYSGGFENNDELINAFKEILEELNL